MKYLITGGTGTFGRALLERLLQTDAKEIRIFSRDESKQDDMRNEYMDNRIKYYIGDVRDYGSLNYAMKGIDHCFHAAAMKQIGSCEQFPYQSVMTNILGVENVANAAIEQNIVSLVFLSSDKAVFPTGVMGMTKGIAEKIIKSKSESTDVRMSITRFGNLINSRNSVIPLWKKQYAEGLPLTVTDPDMTRFIMTIEEAINLVMFAFDNGYGGKIITLPYCKACRIGDLAAAVTYPNKPQILITGMREGERMHEYLIEGESSEDAKKLSVQELNLII